MNHNEEKIAKIRRCVKKPVYIFIERKDDNVYYTVEQCYIMYRLCFF